MPRELHSCCSCSPISTLTLRAAKRHTSVAAAREPPEMSRPTNHSLRQSTHRYRNRQRSNQLSPDDAEFGDDHSSLDSRSFGSSKNYQGINLVSHPNAMRKPILGPGNYQSANRNHCDGPKYLSTDLCLCIRAVSQ